MSDAISLLQQFEVAVHDPGKSSFPDAVSSLHNILANLESLGGNIEQSHREQFYPRVAHSITALFLDSNFELGLSAYQLLCGSHQALSTVFACTDFQDADFLIAKIADVSNYQQLKFKSQSDLMKCLLCYSLRSRFELDLQALSRQLPDITAAAIMGHLSYNFFASLVIQQKMDSLLNQSWPVLRKINPSLPMLVSTSNAWMNCSYATIDNKHDIKRDLNAMIKNGLALQQLNVTCTQVNTSKTKPTIIIPLEMFTSHHAMYRCFSRVIKRLSERFCIIAVVAKKGVDEKAASLFSEVIEFDAAEVVLNLQKLIDRIVEKQPDIIYFPSLGMANISLQLAHVRLAPIQCFTLGHPATSHIDTIDYAIVQEQDFTSSKVYSEKVVLTGNDTSPTINRVLQTIKKPSLRKKPASIRIGVTSKQMKINASFLACCKEIEVRSKTRVEFAFFPGVSGYLYEFVRHEIQRLLPNSDVYPTTDYDTYIANLDACDIRLGTFPFGGANTNMDCFGLGIPFVILDGPEPHSHSDTAQLKQANMPEWLIADSMENYILAALRLIDDNQERLRLSQQMMLLYENDFFFKDEENINMLFDKTMMWLYQNHARIAESGQKVWTLADQGLEL